MEMHSGIDGYQSDSGRIWSWLGISPALLVWSILALPMAASSHALMSPNVQAGGSGVGHAQNTKANSTDRGATVTSLHAHEVSTGNGGNGVVFTARVAKQSDGQMLRKGLGVVRFTLDGKSVRIIQLDRTGKARWSAPVGLVNNRSVAAEYVPYQGTRYGHSSSVAVYQRHTDQRLGRYSR